MKPLRHLAFPFIIAGVLTACGGKAPPSPVSPPEAGSNGVEVRTATLPSRNFLDVSSFPMIVNDRLISGGVAKDGIPALTDPGFVLAGSADAAYLLDEDLVLGRFGYSSMASPRPTRTISAGTMKSLTTPRQGWHCLTVEIWAILR